MARPAYGARHQASSCCHRPREVLTIGFSERADQRIAVFAADFATLVAASSVNSHSVPPAMWPRPPSGAAGGLGTGWSEAIDEAIQEKDNKKAAELAPKLADLEKNLGLEYVALVDALRNIDLNSKEAQEIVSRFDMLDEFCPD